MGRGGGGNGERAAVPEFKTSHPGGGRSGKMAHSKVNKYIPLRGLGTLGGDGQMQMRSGADAVVAEPGGVPARPGECRLSPSTLG